MRTEPTTPKGRATVRRVLDAACVLFARHGVRATTLDQVEVLSRTGRSQLYRYFADKTDLVAAVIAQQVERILHAQQPLLSTMATADDVREWCAVAARQYSADDPIRCPIGSLTHELTEQDTAARTALAAGFRRWHAELTVALRRVHEHGELAADTDPEAVATALLAAYEGGALLANALGDPGHLRTALDTVTDLALTRGHHGTRRKSGVWGQSIP